MLGMYVEIGKGNTYEGIGQFLATGTRTTTRMVLVIIILVID